MAVPIFEDFLYHYDKSTGTLNHGEYAETHGVLLHAQRTEVPFLTALERLYQEVSLAMLHKIQEDGRVHVNSVGGYNVFDESMETQTVWRTELVFPEYSKEDIRIKQFQGGTHWYAYVGDLQIKADNGQTLKWNTYEEAYNEAIQIIRGTI